MPKKKPKEEPPIVEDVSPADGAKARLPAFRLENAEAIAVNDAPVGRGTCAICFDRLPFGVDATFYSCCCKRICTACSNKCQDYDLRCPLCRAAAPKSAEWLRRMQKHADKGNAEAQNVLGAEYCSGGMGLQQNFKRAFQLYQLAAAQGNAEAQNDLGLCYAQGQGVKIDLKTAVQWYRRAAEQGFSAAQYNVGSAFAKAGAWRSRSTKL